MNHDVLFLECITGENMTVAVRFVRDCRETFNGFWDTLGFQLLHYWNFILLAYEPSSASAAVPPVVWSLFIKKIYCTESMPNKIAKLGRYVENNSDQLWLEMQPKDLWALLSQQYSITSRFSMYYSFASATTPCIIWYDIHEKVAGLFDYFYSIKFD